MAFKHSRSSGPRQSSFLFKQSLRSAMLLRRDSQHRDHGGDDVGVVPSHRRIPR
nr:TPA_asm: m69.1-m73.5 uORF 1 [Murid betaherpesvirus 1]DBA07806.1 TPA_asm: m69.1-m73.5 uORF 1 [Murid betaherpesvirus 1]